MSWLRVPKLLLVVVAAVAVVEVQGFKLETGSCPNVPGLDTLDMEKFQGLWYVMESFDGREECVTWNITPGDNNMTWYLQETKGSGILSATGISGSSLTTATLTQGADGSGDLNVKWPLNLAGSYSFIVHNTDYDNYAGVVMCQSLFFGHRQNGIVLARKPHMPIDQRQNARGYFDGLVVEYYKRVRQNMCERDRPVELGGTAPPNHGPLTSDA